MNLTVFLCLGSAVTDAVHCVSQMPIVLIPIHFDRDVQQRPLMPSCQRSVVIRTFRTSDFMTGVPAVPGKDLPIHVRSLYMPGANGGDCVCVCVCVCVVCVCVCVCVHRC